MQEQALEPHRKQLDQLRNQTKQFNNIKGRYVYLQELLHWGAYRNRCARNTLPTTWPKTVLKGSTEKLGRGCLLEPRPRGRDWPLCSGRRGHMRAPSG